MAVGLGVDTMLDSAFKEVAQTLACTVHRMHYWICDFNIINRTPLTALSPFLTFLYKLVKQNQKPKLSSIFSSYGS